MALKKTDKDAATGAVAEAAAAPTPEAADPAAETVTTGSGNIVASAGTHISSQPVEPEAKTPSVIEKDQVSAEEQAAHTNTQLQAEAEAKGRDPKKAKVLVEVENLKSMAQRQPSTGTWVEPKGRAYLLDDNWLENQLRAKILKKV